MTITALVGTRTGLFTVTIDNDVTRLSAPALVGSLVTGWSAGEFVEHAMAGDGQVGQD